MIKAAAQKSARAAEIKTILPAKVFWFKSSFAGAQKNHGEQNILKAKNYFLLLLPAMLLRATQTIASHLVPKK
jgi:hypothetical protein